MWTELIQQSRGRLHVFLPLLDQGLDAVIHRRTDGEYIPVQVKCRTATIDGMVQLMIPGSKLVDDGALLIAGLFTDDGLGPMLLVVDEGTFKNLAAHDVGLAGDIYMASFSMHPRASRWRQHMVMREQLAERLLGASPPSSPEPEPPDYGLEPRDRHSGWLGFLGEAEVIRRLSENPRLDLFRPFPDLEMVEVLARDNMNGRYAGLQVKTAVPGRKGEAYFKVRKRTFVPAPSTLVAGLAWLAEDGRFADECLLLPAEELASIAIDDDDCWVLVFRPESPVRTPLDPYRRPLAKLGEFIGQVLSAE